jgi:hypothetical protein
MAVKRRYLAALLFWFLRGAALVVQAAQAAQAALDRQSSAMWAAVMVVVAATALVVIHLSRAAVAARVATPGMVAQAAANPLALPALAAVEVAVQMVEARGLHPVAAVLVFWAKVLLALAVTFLTQAALAGAGARRVVLVPGAHPAAVAAALAWARPALFASFGQPQAARSPAQMYRSKEALISAASSG